MSSEQLATRILAEQTKISGDKMRKAELNKNDLALQGILIVDLNYFRNFVDNIEIEKSDDELTTFELPNDLEIKDIKKQVNKYLDEYNVL